VPKSLIRETPTFLNETPIQQRVYARIGIHQLQRQLTSSKATWDIEEALTGRSAVRSPSEFIDLNPFDVLTVRRQSNSAASNQLLATLGEFQHGTFGN